jgi:3-phenylpropionate/trans-cinnamate dioxygenase ferredoxin reductase subunit
MHAALCRLALFPNVSIIPVVSEPQDVSPAIRAGRPIDCLPQLSSDDVIYVSGAPALTEQVARAAKAAAARCYADPFVSHAELTAHQKLMSVFAGWLDGPRNKQRSHPATGKPRSTLNLAEIS